MDESIKVPNRLVTYRADGTIDPYELHHSNELLKSINKLEYYFAGYPDDFDYSNFATGCEILGQAWQLSNTYLINKFGYDKIIHFFEISKPYNMTDDERDYLYGLADTITIFRGSQIHRNIPYPALSWTEDEEVAASYARNRNGVIYKGLAHKDNILCIYFDEREVLIKPNTVEIMRVYPPEY